MRPALADDTVHTRHSVAYITRHAGAIAGINGGFFAAQGPPVGLLVIDGEWICSPLINRTILAASTSGKLRMGRWAFREVVRLHNDGMNIERRSVSSQELLDDGRLNLCHGIGCRQAHQFAGDGGGAHELSVGIAS